MKHNKKEEYESDEIHLRNGTDGPSVGLGGTGTGERYDHEPHGGGGTGIYAGHHGCAQDKRIATGRAAHGEQEGGGVCGRGAACQPDSGWDDEAFQRQRGTAEGAAGICPTGLWHVRQPGCCGQLSADAFGK